MSDNAAWVIGVLVIGSIFVLPIVFNGLTDMIYTWRRTGCRCTCKEKGNNEQRNDSSSD